MSSLLVLSLHYDRPETGLWKPSQAKLREDMLQHLCVLKLPCVKKQIHVKYASASIHLSLNLLQPVEKLLEKPSVLLSLNNNFFLYK
jgi:hypothetical protein